MINGAHAVLYSHDAEATRAALGKILGTRSVDAGGGWLIFALPPAELAVHPAEEGGRAELYLMTNDIAATVTALQAKGIPDRQADQRPGLGSADGHHPPRRGRARPLPAPPPDCGAAELSSIHTTSAAPVWMAKPGSPRPSSRKLRACQCAAR
jgi:hypothetical protein